MLSFLNLFTRQVNMESIYKQVYDSLEKQGMYYACIMEHYVEDDRNFIIFTNDSKLYRLYYTVFNDIVTLGKIQRVDIEFVEVSDNEQPEPQMSDVRNLVLRRNNKGQLILSMIACSSTLNRIGTIETRKMFDYLEQNYSKQKQRAYFTFFHLGEALKFGEIQEVFRYGDFLLVSGVVDETTFVGQNLQTALSKQDDWGVSIGFYALDRKFEKIGGVDVEINDAAELIECSLLKENTAASYFTGVQLMGFTRDEAKRQLLDLAGEGAEDQIEALLKVADVRQRTIEQEQLVTRSQEVEQPVVEAVELEQKEISIDDDVIAEIVSKVIASLPENVAIRSLTEELNLVKSQLEQLKEHEASKPVSERMKTVANEVPEVENKDYNSIVSDRISQLRIKRGK